MRRREQPITVRYIVREPSHEAYQDLIRLLATWADECREKLIREKRAQQRTNTSTPEKPTESSKS